MGTNYELWTTHSHCTPNADITITDPTPKTYQTCSAPGGNVIITGNDPFTSTSVRQITTSSFNNVYLGVAVQQAINDLTISNALEIM